MPGPVLGGGGEFRHPARALGPRLPAALGAARGVQRRQRRLPPADLACQTKAAAPALRRPRIAEASGSGGIRLAAPLVTPSGLARFVLGSGGVVSQSKMRGRPR